VIPINGGVTRIQLNLDKFGTKFVVAYSNLIVLFEVP